jgi:two-component system, LuxR family, response regulator FixJ
MNEAPKVYIVDDDAAVRDALAALLGSVGLAATAFDSAESFLAEAHAGMRGCVLLDVRMPGMGGLELQPRLQERGVLLPVIFITGHGDVAMAVRAMKAGAADFIEKPFNEQQVLDRIHACLGEDDRAFQARRARESARSGFGQLTAREMAVMERIAAGMHSKAIAAELDITERTVDVHRFHIMRKVGVRSLADLLQRWFQAH